MLNIKSETSKIEDKWETILYTHCRKIFGSVNIPSHDHDHHKRVWTYAKQIIEFLSDSAEFDTSFLEALIFACYFHDTGLAKNPGATHGVDSLRFFKHFVAENDIQLEFKKDVEDAILMHDDKSYKVQHPNNKSLLTILSVADDIDAFGYIGIIRYIEIYKMRMISDNDLPIMVLQNLENRYQYFLNNYAFLKKFSQVHEHRYLVTKTFFEKLRDTSNEEFDIIYPVIISKLINNELTTALNSRSISMMHPFFAHLKKEIDLF